MEQSEYYHIFWFFARNPKSYNIIYFTILMKASFVKLGLFWKFVVCFNEWISFFPFDSFGNNWNMVILNGKKRDYSVWCCCLNAIQCLRWTINPLSTIYTFLIDVIILRTFHLLIRSHKMKVNEASLIPFTWSTLYL